MGREEVVKLLGLGRGRSGRQTGAGRGLGYSGGLGGGGNNTSELFSTPHGLFFTYTFLSWPFGVATAGSFLLCRTR